MILKRIGVLSAGKINGIISAAMGLIFGFFISAGFFIGMAAGMPRDEGALLSSLFGVGSVVVLPIFYGIAGFIFGIIGALIYNGVAKFIGGLEIELEEKPQNVAG